jgi:hypothetical protein
MKTFVGTSGHDGEEEHSVPSLNVTPVVQLFRWVNYSGFMNESIMGQS